MKKPSRKLRILVLVHKGLIPPNSLKGLTEEKIEEIKIEYDVVSALKKLGHKVFVLGLYKNIDDLDKAIDEFKPNFAFNLLEEFPDLPYFDHHVISYLELRKIPYSGCNPRGLVIAKDKGLTKKILTYNNIKTPQFTVFAKRKPIKEQETISYPLIVKSVSDEGSAGISDNSVVYDFHNLRKRARQIHLRTKTHAIAEEFIDGREIYVGIIGNDIVETFTPWELTVEKMEDGSPLIATSKVKWDTKYQKKAGVKTGPAKLTDAQKDKFSSLSKEIYKLLGLNGYARLDFRMTHRGAIYFIEANPNPSIRRDEDFAASAKHKKINYETLIRKIVNVGMRYDPYI